MSMTLPEQPVSRLINYVFISADIVNGHRVVIAVYGPGEAALVEGDHAGETAAVDGGERWIVEFDNFC